MSDETENYFGPAALVLALGLAFAAMFWAAGKAHGAELPRPHEVSVPCTDPARCALPWKIGIAMGVKPGPDEPPVLMSYGIVQEGFKTEKECRSKKGIGNPSLKKINAAFQEKLAQKLGLPPEAIVIAVDCLKVPPPTKPEPKGESI